MIIGTIIAFVGAIIISLHDYAHDSSTLAGNLLAIGGALGAAGYFLAGRKLRAEIDTFPYVTAVYTISALLLLVMAIISGVSLFNYNLKEFLLFFAIAIIPQIIGHTSLNWALKYFSATAVSIIILGEPIGASLLAFFILGESLTLIKIFGGIIIICGVVILLLAEAKYNNNKK